MNKERRKELNKASELLSDAQSKIQEARDIIECANGDEQSYLDNMPENLQGSDKYEVAESAIESMEEALNSLEEIDSSLDEAIGAVEAATE